MSNLIVNLGILPKVFNDKDYDIVIDFFRMLKEKFGEVYYTETKDGVPIRLGEYRDKFLEDIKEIGYIKTEQREQTRLFMEEGEGSIEEYVGNDERFKAFAKLRLNYTISSLKTKIDNEDNPNKKESLERDLEKYEKIRDRFEMESQPNKETQAKEPNTFMVEKVGLYIHLDFANFFLDRVKDWHDLSLWADFAKTLVRLIKNELGYKGDYEVIAYLEGYFRQRTLKEKECLHNFMEKFQNNDKYDDESMAQILQAFLKMLDFKVYIPPKEAEQAIPDIISDIKSYNPNALHVIVSDDKARDSTECDLRVVYDNRSKHRVERIRKAKKVISLQELAIKSPLIAHFLGKDSNDNKENKDVKTKTLDRIDFVADGIKNFSLLAEDDKARLIHVMLELYKDSPEAFIDLWLELEYDIKDEFLGGLSGYSNNALKVGLLLVLFDIGKDQKEEILNLLKDHLSEYEGILELLELKVEEEYLETDLKTLERRYGDKIKLSQKINDLKSKIDQINKLAKDENINEKRRASLEKELEKKQAEYSKLKSQIEDIEGKINKLKDDINELQTAKNNLLNQTYELNNQKANLEKDIEIAKQDESKLSTEIGSLNDELTSLQKQISVLNKEKGELENRVTLLNQEKTALEEEKNRLEEQIKNLNDEIGTIQQEVADKEEIIKKRREELRHLESVKETYDKLKLLDEMREFIDQHKNDIKNLNKEIEELKPERDRLREKRDELEQEKNGLEAYVNNLRDQVSKLEDAYNYLEAEKKSLDNKKWQIEKKEKQLSEEKKELEDFISKEEPRIESLEDEVKRLKNQKQSIEQQIKTKEEDIDKLNKEIERITKETEQLDKKLNSLRKTKEELDGKKNRLIEEKKSLEEYKRMYKDDANLVKEIDKLLEKIKAFLDKLPS